MKKLRYSDYLKSDAKRAEAWAKWRFISAGNTSAIQCFVAGYNAALNDVKNQEHMRRLIEVEKYWAKISKWPMWPTPNQKRKQTNKQRLIKAKNDWAKITEIFKNWNPLERRPPK